MPCDSITTVEIEAGKMNPQLAKAALEAMGLTVTHDKLNTYTHEKGSYNHATGECVWTLSRYNRAETAESLTAEFRRQFSKQVITSQAKRFGWQLRPNKANPFAFNVLR